MPLHQLDRFLEQVPEAVAAAGGERAILFGHLGDGNVHVNVLGPDPDDLRVDDAVLELALGCGGTISAEHGVGVAKAQWLERARGAEEVAAMRSIKRALDPDEPPQSRRRAPAPHGLALGLLRGDARRTARRLSADDRVKLGAEQEHRGRGVEVAPSSTITAARLPNTD